MKIYFIIFLILSSSIYAFNFNLKFLNLTIPIRNQGLYRSFQDGSFAKSCDEYRTPSPTGRFKYLGDIGDGIYRIKPDANPPIDVYCDMTTQGGGWTLVSNAATTSSSYLSSRDASVNAGVVNSATNWNIMGAAGFDGIYGSAWQSTNKLVKIKDSATGITTTVPGIFLLVGTKHWRNTSTNILNPASGLNYIPELFLDGTYGDFGGGYGYAPGWVGNPNVGRSSWCDSTTDVYLYMNGNASHNGVASWQGGCNSNFYYKTNLSWQIYTK